jgi:hypothetical protein
MALSDLDWVVWGVEWVIWGVWFAFGSFVLTYLIMWVAVNAGSYDALLWYSAALGVVFGGIPVSVALMTLYRRQREGGGESGDREINRL